MTVGILRHFSTWTPRCKSIWSKNSRLVLILLGMWPESLSASTAGIFFEVDMSLDGHTLCYDSNFDEMFPSLGTLTSMTTRTKFSAESWKLTAVGSHLVISSDQPSSSLGALRPFHSWGFPVYLYFEFISFDICFQMQYNLARLWPVLSLTKV